MYRLVLVDDEYLELEMLQNHVDWAALGFAVVGTAKNGQAALALCEALAPDVVITDIKMPIMDGVEFAKRLYAKGGKTKIVFLSGYNQFDYLRAAFQVEAIDYLLKPLDLEELPPLMETVRQRCGKEAENADTARAAATEFLRRAILGGPAEAEALLAQCRAFTGDAAADTFYVAVAVIGEYALWDGDPEEGQGIIARSRAEIAALAAQYHAGVLPVQEHTDLLLGTAPITPAPRDWCEADRGLWANIICRQSAVCAAEIPAVYARLNSLRHWWVTHYDTRPVLYEDEILNICHAEESAAALPTLDIHMLLQYLQTGDLDATDHWVLQYYAGASAAGSHANTVNLFDFLYENLILPNRALRDAMEEKAGLYARLFKIESLAVLENAVCRYLHKLAAALAQTQGDPSQMIVENIRAYIRKNYDQQLTIEKLVEKFYFSPNYLRSVFKKYEGRTVLEFITEVRLQKAEALLRDPQQRVSQISAQVGYSNPSYFCLLFAKRYGLTPNQYRTRLVGPGRTEE
ncbi:MAG: response regulator [Gemmiger sp.]|nr:response regulator [Gemmiger sp.]